MKHILITLLILSSIIANAQDISMDLRDATLDDFVKEIQSRTNYTFVYGNDVKFKHAVNIRTNNSTLEKILDKVLAPHDIAYIIQGRHITLTKKQSSTTKSDITINGYIKDATSSETLIGATVFSKHGRKGAVTNSYGFFSITLPSGDDTMSFSYLGYESKTMNATFKNDTTINIYLIADNKIEEITVEADRPETGTASSRTGATTMPVEMIQRQPALLGEPDVLKALQTLPGVQRGMVGTSGVHVRGGSPDQNLYLLDGVPMYNIDHILGFMSAFTPDAVKHVDFYKASFPSRYGGRLSSVIDVRTKDGNMQQWHGMGQIGTLSSHMSLEGPIKKDKTSLILSARRSYFDLLANPIIKAGDPDIKKYKMNFYDINAKVNHIFSDDDRLFVSFYMGRDVLGLTTENKSSGSYSRYNSTYDFDLRWGNTLGSLRWNHIFTPKIFSNVTLAYNRFNFGIKMDDIAEEQKKTDQDTRTWETNKSEFIMRYNSGIDDLTATMDFDYHPIPHHHAKFGGQYIRHTFRPSMTVTSTLTMSSDTTLQDKYNDNEGKKIGNEFDIYAEDDLSLGDRWQANAGVHATLFAVDGKVYPSVEPRLSTSYSFAKGLRAKASYTTMHQYVHLLQTAPISLPSDLWVPIDKNIKPMFSQQVSMGLSSNSLAGWELTAEVYYKEMRNILDYKDGSGYSGSTRGWQELVAKGKGLSRGLELMARKAIGKTTGSASYTLSKTDRKFGPEISGGKTFPYKFDRRNAINITVMHKFGERVDIAASWNYMSGSWETVAKQRTTYITPIENGYTTLFPEESIDMEYEGIKSSEYDYYDRRNNYHLKPSHQLDLSVNFYKRLKHCSRTLNISVMNAYNRKNQDLVYVKRKPVYKQTTVNDPETGLSYTQVEQTGKKTVLNQTSIIPIIPSISYTIRF